jgi:hypothetical protein
MKNRTTISLLSLGLLLCGSLAMPRLALASDTDSKDVTKLLMQTKEQALQLKQEAETLETFTRSDVSRDSHACAVDQIREDVDALARQVAKLDELVKDGSPWQKDAVERIRPVAYELVSNANAMIHNLNSGGCLTSGDYVSYVHANVTLADRLLATIKQYVESPRR